MLYGIPLLQETEWKQGLAEWKIISGNMYSAVYTCVLKWSVQNGT